MICKELAMKLCEEVLLKDEKYQRLNNEIIPKEKAFMQTLSKSQQKDYLNLEALINKANSYAQVLLFCLGLF